MSMRRKNPSPASALSRSRLTDSTRTRLPSTWMNPPRSSSGPVTTAASRLWKSSGFLMARSGQASASTIRKTRSICWWRPSKNSQGRQVTRRLPSLMRSSFRPDAPGIQRVQTGRDKELASSFASISRIVSSFAFVEGPAGTALQPDAGEIDSVNVPISRAIRIASSLSNPMRGR